MLLHEVASVSHMVSGGLLGSLLAFRAAREMWGRSQELRKVRCKQLGKWKLEGATERDWIEIAGQLPQQLPGKCALSQYG
jgi:hypothetical protein